MIVFLIYNKFINRDVFLICYLSRDMVIDIFVLLDISSDNSKY